MNLPQLKPDIKDSYAHHLHKEKESHRFRSVPRASEDLDKEMNTQEECYVDNISQRRQHMG